MLSSVTQGNLHYDTPIYLMNIGSVYQKIGRRENANGFWRTANENLQQVLLSLLPPANEVWDNVIFSPIPRTLQDFSKENLRAHRQNVQKRFYLQALKYYDMSLDAYRKQNMYGFGLTIVVLKNKANAKYDLEQYEEALKMADEVFDYYFHIQQCVYVDSSHTKGLFARNVTILSVKV